MCTENPVDMENAVIALYGNYKVYFTLLTQLEKKSINPTMKDIIKPFENKDYNQIQLLVHSLKEACEFIWASRLYIVCYYILEHFECQQFDMMLEYYPSLVEATIEYKVYSRWLHAKNIGNKYVF